MVKIISTLAAAICVVSFLFTLYIYFKNKPNITFTFQCVDKPHSDLFNELYNINLTIENESEYHYKELILHPEKGTLFSNDTGTALIDAYARDKNMYWPPQSRRILFNDYIASTFSLGYKLPLLVPKGLKQTEIEAALYLNLNACDVGVFAIFNPFLNYKVKKTVKVDLTKLLNE
jgi:hypothetical protein